MLAKLLSLRDAHKLLPFYRMSYAQHSVYVWQDETGQTHDIRQGEGGEVEAVVRV